MFNADMTILTSSKRGQSPLVWQVVCLVLLRHVHVKLAVNVIGMVVTLGHSLIQMRYLVNASTGAPRSA